MLEVEEIDVTEVRVRAYAPPAIMIIITTTMIINVVREIALRATGFVENAREIVNI